MIISGLQFLAFLPFDKIISKKISKSQSYYYPEDIVWVLHPSREILTNANSMSELK